LQKFAELAHNEENAPRRPFGPAELMVEASFADLRYGGDGNLSQAYRLAKTGYNGKNAHDRPFPDSWIATAAPIALGLLTEILCEKLLFTGNDGRCKLWPIIRDLFHSWIFGQKLPIPNNQASIHYENLPCEALVRIGCKEISRVAMCMSKALEKLDANEAHSWWYQICEDLSSTISQNVTFQSLIRDELVASKLHALGITNETRSSNCDKVDESSNQTQDTLFLNTSFGHGKIESTNQMTFETVESDSPIRMTMTKIILEWGGTMYSPEFSTALLDSCHPPMESMTNNLSKSKSRDLSRENYLNRYIPALKIRSIATFVLQRYIPKYKSAIAKIIRENDAKHLFSSLEESRFIANKLNRDEDLAHAFQESWRSEWGDGVREVELALAAMGGNSRHKGGSEAFFLTQEAGSNMAIIHLSSLLFISWENNKGAELNHWNNRDLFAESLLLERIVDVLNKFLDSETKDSHLVDPNLWNSTRDMKSGKIILCCTSFF